MLVLNKVSEDNASQMDANGRKTVQNNARVVVS